MFFFMRKKEIVLDVFTNEKSILDNFPIQRASKFIPHWWRNLPAYEVREENFVNVPRPTIKSCPGLIDYFSKGFVIPSWTDIAISTHNNGSWNSVSSFNAQITEHDRYQYGENFNNFIQLKINSPWFIREKLGIEFIQISPMWNNVDYWNTTHIVPGVLNYKHQHSTNINLFANKIEQTIYIKSGLPLAHLIPLSDFKIKIKTHLADPQEFINLHIPRHNFLGTYRMLQKTKQKNKCPFNFK